MDQLHNNSDMINCPACGHLGIRISNYTSLMVLRRDLGLFSVECPNCATKVSSIHPIPAYLQKEISLAANEVGAGMGESS